MSEPLWTPIEIAMATGAALIDGDDWQANGLSIDTRSLAPGDLFIALHAARDGHDFIAQAYTAGAAAALVDHRVGSGPQALVGDTLDGLARMGVFARDRSNACRVAVTGSVGKSSVKAAIAQIFEAAGPAHASEKSYNNHWGVPLSLAKMPKHTKRAVFEVGMNHPGEIAPLAELVRPHIAVITRIAPAHMEAFGGLENVAEEKAQIWSSMAQNGVAIIPADDPLYKNLRDFAMHHNVARIVTFGVENSADVRVTDVTADFTSGTDGLRGQMNVFGELYDFKLGVSGMHWASNAAAAVAAAIFCGVDAGDAIASLAQLKPLPGRGGPVQIAVKNGQATMLDDAYNANPASMLAALNTLGDWPAQRRIAVLGDMLELGESARRYHEKLSWDIQNNDIDLVYCVGPLMKFLFQSLPAKRQGGWFETPGEALDALQNILKSNDVILLKGSNGSRIHQIAAALKAKAAAGQS